MENDPKTTILNADDNDAGRYAISCMLRQAGFDVKQASNGRETLRLAEEEQPDLILLDVNLPDISGFEVCRMIKNNPLTSHIPVLHISATYLNDKAKVKGLETADGYLTQPVEPPVLISTIKALLRMKWAEKESRKSEERFKQVTENAVEWIWEVDAQGLYTFASPVVRNILGYRPEEVVGIKHFYDFFHTEDRERLKKAAFEIFEGQRLFREFVNRNVRKDGETVWLSTNGMPFRDEKGNFLGYRGADTDITERKRAEDALRKNEQHFRLLYEQSPVAYQSLDAEGRFLEVNEAWLKLLGFGRDEVIGHWFGDFFVPSEVDLFRERFSRFKSAGEIRCVECNLLHKNGSLITVSIDGRIARDETGAFKRTHCVLHNITERKRAEDEIRSLAKFPSENPNPVLRLSRAGTILYANEAGQALLRDWGCALSSYAPPFWRDLVTEVLTSRSTKIVDIQHGEQVWSFFVAPIIDAGYINLYGRDITERKRIEEALINSETLYKEAQKTAHIGHWELDTSTMVPTWSEEIFAIFGLDPAQGEPSFKDHQKIIHPDDWNILNKAVTTASIEGVPFDIEFRLLHPDRSIRWMNAKGCAIGDSAGQIVRIFGTAQDITEHKQAEEEQERLRAHLEAKNREMEAFVYTISHDLRAPLISLSGFSSVLQKQYESQLGKEGKHYLERIQANVAHMDALITDLLELARIGHVVGLIEEIDVGPLLRKIQDGLVVRLKEAGAEFVVREPLPTVCADKGRIHQVFVNLIDNAVKYRSAERALRIEVGCRQESGFYRFHVADNGIGIAPQYHEQIFTPFRKLHPGMQGVGIGLALVKKIVERHGGRVWVESEDRKGSTFYFTIPGG